MPAKELMGWEPNQRLWRKTYKGKTYTRSCKQLAEWSGKLFAYAKESSYQIANEWFRAQVEAAPKKPLDSIAQSYVDNLVKRGQVAASMGDTNLASFIRREVDRITTNGRLDDDFFDRYYPLPGTQRRPIDDEIDELNADEWTPNHKFKEIEVLDPINVEWSVRTEKVDAAAPTPANLTIAATITAYLDNQKARHDAGDIGIDECAMARDCLVRFRDWLDGTNHVNVIDAAKFQAWWRYLIKPDNGIGPDFETNILRHTRSYIHYLYRLGYIELPKNIDDRTIKIRSQRKPIVIMEVNELNTLIDNAYGPMKLYLMLMANCGFTQQDISDLTQQQVDLVNGRITRKRSKAKGYANAPIVSYRLWPQTLELLKRYQSTDPVHFLLNERGKPLLVKSLKQDNGKAKVDCIATSYYKLKGKVNIKKPLRSIRKTSSSIIYNDPHRSHWHEHFLGHTPKTVAVQRYSKPFTEVFDEVVDWLGVKYGYVTKVDDDALNAIDR